MAHDTLVYTVSSLTLFSLIKLFSCHTKYTSFNLVKYLHHVSLSAIFFLETYLIPKSLFSCPFCYIPTALNSTILHYSLMSLNVSQRLCLFQSSLYPQHLTTGNPKNQRINYGSEPMHKKKSQIPFENSMSLNTLKE